MNSKGRLCQEEQEAYTHGLMLRANFWKVEDVQTKNGEERAGCG